MSIVRPFRGLRPVPGKAEEVAAPPYDVLSTDEARQMAADNPNTFLRVNKAELEFDSSVDPYSEEVYNRAKKNLARLILDGIMVRDKARSFYLYRLGWRGQKQTGLVALTSVEEYRRGKIKKHEHTRPVKVKDRADHIEHLEAQVGPVFSTFKSNKEINNLFAKASETSPEVSFELADGVSHELWPVSDESTVEAIVAAFAGLDCLYIADGHHRSEAASEICRRREENNPNHDGSEPYNFFLNVLFAADELRILSYNRVVTDLGGLSKDQFLKAVSDKFDVVESSDPVDPQRLNCFGLYLEGSWYRLKARDGSFDPAHPTQSIDAAILSANLLDPVLGIKDMRTDKRIDFIGGIRGVEELTRLVDSGKFAAAFSLYPTSIEQLLRVADAGEVMPPKSTWFEPKLRSGMVVNLLAE